MDMLIHTELYMPIHTHRNIPRDITRLKHTCTYSNILPAPSIHKVDRTSQALRSFDR